MTDGFAPIEDTGCTVLILGTGPSIESLKRGEYYGNPRNDFWPIMSRLLGEEPASYEEKKAMLLRHHIALWDTLSRFDRKGSLDSGYRKVEANPLREFISAHRSLRAVFFTGKKAEEFYRRLVGYYPAGLVFQTLPSPSPANTMARDDKFVLYQTVLAPFVY